MQSKINFKNKKRVVIKIGSNSLLHKDTKKIDYLKIEKLIREIVDLKNRGLDVCLVSSGAIAVGRDSLINKVTDETNSTMQALASIGQARLVSIYQNIFRQYNQEAGQVLIVLYARHGNERLRQGVQSRGRSSIDDEEYDY